MAFVKVIDIHSTVKSCIDYIKSPEKAGQGLVYTNCVFGAEDLQMKHTKEKFAKTDGILAHHYVQSFDPGEITPVAAFNLAKELAQTKFKGHEYVIATHTDKEHVHSHIVINSVNYQTGKKHCSEWKTLYGIREYSDYQCVRDGYSIIEPNMKNKSLQYKEWLEIRNGKSWKQRIRDTIDSVLEYPEVVDYETFIREFIARGGYVDRTRGSYRLDGMNRNARERSLGYDYFKVSIEARIEHKMNSKYRLVSNMKVFVNTKHKKYKRYYPKRTGLLLLDEILNSIEAIYDTRKKIRTKEMTTKSKVTKAVEYYGNKIMELNELIKFLDKNNIRTAEDITKMIDEEVLISSKLRLQISDVENSLEFRINEPSLLEKHVKLKLSYDSSQKYLSELNSKKYLIANIEKSRKLRIRSIEVTKVYPRKC